MCLAVPAKVIEKKDMVATVEVEGIRRDISLMLLPEANEGDYILMHAGFAIQVIDEEEISLGYLMQIIQELPDQYRIVFSLYVLDDYSHQEISEMLSISTGTTKSNLHRARLLLKEKIEKKTVTNLKKSAK